MDVQIETLERHRMTPVVQAMVLLLQASSILDEELQDNDDLRAGTERFVRNAILGLGLEERAAVVVAWACR
jgi:hypothetical protein